MRAQSTLLDSILIAASLVAAVVIHGFLADFTNAGPAPFLTDVLLQILLITISFVVMLSTQQEGRQPKSWVLLFEISCLGVGTGLMIQAIVLYLGAEPMPMETLLAGQILAALLLTARRRLFWLPPPPTPDTVLVGLEPEAQPLLKALGPRLLGVLDTTPAQSTSNQTPAAVRYLGTPEKALDPLPEWQTLIVSPSGLQSLDHPAALMQARRQGHAVEDLSACYERTLFRVCCGLLRPTDFFFSSGDFMASRHAMAAQAVYNNVIGLILLILIFPVLFLTSIAVALFSGRGPVIEMIECAGFQGIPFQLLRFRTRRWDGSADYTPIGPLLHRLRLVNLPMFINVVRGELALFGPRPARLEFHERLSQLIPFYFHRSSLKPGIFGWSQLNLGRQDLADEVLRLEYDFYYIRKISPILDLEVFLQTIFRT